MVWDFGSGVDPQTWAKGSDLGLGARFECKFLGCKG